MSPVMLGAMGKAQRTGSKIPLRDRELKLTGVPSRQARPQPRKAPLSVCLSDPPTRLRASFLSHPQGPGPRAQSCSITAPPCPCVPWASLGKAFSRAGGSKEHPDPTCYWGVSLNGCPELASMGRKEPEGKEGAFQIRELYVQ